MKGPQYGGKSFPLCRHASTTPLFIRDYYIIMIEYEYRPGKGIMLKQPQCLRFSASVRSRDRKLRKPKQTLIAQSPHVYLISNPIWLFSICPIRGTRINAINKYAPAIVVRLPIARTNGNFRTIRAIQVPPPDWHSCSPSIAFFNDHSSGCEETRLCRHINQQIRLDKKRTVRSPLQYERKRLYFTSLA